MVKYYCDICGEEVKADEARTDMKGQVGRLKFRVLRALDGTWNAGVVCRKCLAKAIATSEIGWHEGDDYVSDIGFDDANEVEEEPDSFPSLTSTKHIGSTHGKQVRDVGAN